ncbi:hypothetical protein [Streptomyces sp. NPDC051776]|uniref:hypothetical protein n=1 Tax=Streptomyces sp. NPDC051776 TaxID=3155414 RepID=UPI00343E3237
MLYAVLYPESRYQGKSFAASYTGPRVYGLSGLGLPRICSVRVPDARSDGVLGTVTYGMYVWEQRPHHLLPTEHEIGMTCLRITEDVPDLGEWSGRARYVVLYIASSVSPRMCHTNGAFRGADLPIVESSHPH